MNVEHCVLQSSAMNLVGMYRNAVRFLGTGKLLELLGTNKVRTNRGLLFIVMFGMWTRMGTSTYLNVLNSVAYH